MPPTAMQYNALHIYLSVAGELFAHDTGKLKLALINAEDGGICTYPSGSFPVFPSWIQD